MLNIELFGLIWGLLSALWGTFCLDGYISTVKNKNTIKFIRVGWLFGTVVGIAMCLINFIIAFI